MMIMMIDLQINGEIEDENNDDFQRGLPSLPTSWQSRKGGLDSSLVVVDRPTQLICISDIFC